MLANYLTSGAAEPRHLPAGIALVDCALFFYAAFPASEFGVPWPAGVPLQIHMMEDDEWALEDLPGARELTETVDDAALFLYPGDRHLFADSSLPDFDEDAAALPTQRVLKFLTAIS